MHSKSHNCLVKMEGYAKINKKQLLPHVKGICECKFARG